MSNWGQKLQGFGEALAGRGSQWQNQQQEARLMANIQDTARMATMFQMGDIPGVANILTQRIEALQKSGGDPSHSMATLQMLQENPEAAFRDVMAGYNTFAQMGYLKPLGSAQEQQFGSGQQRYMDDAGNLFYGTTRRNKGTGGFDAVFAPIGHDKPQQGRLRPVNDMGLTPEQEIEYRGGVKAAEKTATESAGRGQNVINFGYDAARGYPVIRRSIDLLNEIETGGIDAARVKAKQFFGVEGADEAELSANLGKAVLSQLKAIFGSQFTEREGGRLERIEAGFGKSTEGNKRLLGQALKMSDKYINDAIARAASSGDYDTVDELRSYMKMDLTPVAPAQDAADDPLGLR